MDNRWWLWPSFYSDVLKPPTGWSLSWWFVDITLFDLCFWRTFPFHSICQYVVGRLQLAYTHPFPTIHQGHSGGMWTFVLVMDHWPVAFFISPFGQIFWWYRFDCGVMRNLLSVVRQPMTTPKGWWNETPRWWTCRKTIHFVHPKSASQIERFHPFVIPTSMGHLDQCSFALPERGLKRPQIWMLAACCIQMLSHVWLPVGRWQSCFVATFLGRSLEPSNHL